MKKTRSKKSCDTVPLNDIIIMFLSSCADGRHVLICQYRLKSFVYLYLLLQMTVSVYLSVQMTGVPVCIVGLFEFVAQGMFTQSVTHYKDKDIIGLINWNTFILKRHLLPKSI